MDDRSGRLLRKRLFLGLGLSLAYAAVLYLLIWRGSGGMLFISGLIFMPMAIASVFSAVADPLGRASIGTHLKWALIGIAVLLVLRLPDGGRTGGFDHRDRRAARRCLGADG